MQVKRKNGAFQISWYEAGEGFSLVNLYVRILRSKDIYSIPV